MVFLYNNPGIKIRRKTLRNGPPKPEQILWQYLKGKGLQGWKFRRQYSVRNYILDFYCPKSRLAIEIDGDSHFDAKAKAYDKKREMFLSAKNIRIVRFTNTEIRMNTEQVINGISKYLP